mmetsp:Transcript_34033/g.49941  ORF Transcript_34033/g.49941 Transcript_34033/m.49941 type:complete len:232 (-) Transcript_34033:359-1054(-)
MQKESEVQNWRWQSSHSATPQARKRNLPTAHRRSWDISHITSRIEMVVHAHKKDVITLVSGFGTAWIICPCHAVTMNSTLTVVVVPRVNCETSVHTSGLWVPFHVNIAEISVVTRIGINTVCVIGRGTVAVIVICLTVRHPAAHGRTKWAIVEVFHNTVRKLNLHLFCVGFINIVNARCVICKHVRGLARNVRHAVFHACLVLFVPDSPTIEVNLIEYRFAICSLLGHVFP